MTLPHAPGAPEFTLMACRCTSCSAGNCPATAPTKVYRSFNNRSAQNDGNHRYTVSTARYNQMIAAGYSADGPVFCVASATDAAEYRCCEPPP